MTTRESDFEQKCDFIKMDSEEDMEYKQILLDKTETQADLMVSVFPGRPGR